MWQLWKLRGTHSAAEILKPRWAHSQGPLAWAWGMLPDSALLPSLGRRAQPRDLHGSWPLGDAFFSRVEPWGDPFPGAHLAECWQFQEPSSSLEDMLGVQAEQVPQPFPIHGDCRQG